MRWEDVKYAIALHRKQSGKVHGQTPPDEEMIDSCPVVGVKSNLGTDSCVTYTVYCLFLNQWGEFFIIT